MVSPVLWEHVAQVRFLPPRPRFLLKVHSVDYIIKHNLYFCMNDRYQLLLDKSKNNYFSPHELENFISKEEINYCIDIYNELPKFEPASHARATRKDYLMHSEHDKRMQNLFLPKLQKFFPGQRIVVDGGNFTYWHQPVGIHTDGYQFAYKTKEDIVNFNHVLGSAVLIPLETDTHLGTPKTVFFNQTLFGGDYNFTDHNKDTIGLAVDNFTFKEFEYTNETQKLLSHIPKEELYGFSIEKIIPWKYGNALVWHRAQFHSSSSFVGFNNKLHLVFFIYNAQQ
jgi:hypothetical protein